MRRSTHSFGLTGSLRLVRLGVTATGAALVIAGVTAGPAQATVQPQALVGQTAPGAAETFG